MTKEEANKLVEEAKKQHIDFLRKHATIESSLAEMKKVAEYIEGNDRYYTISYEIKRSLKALVIAKELADKQEKIETNKFLGVLEETRQARNS